MSQTRAGIPAMSRRTMLGGLAATPVLAAAPARAQGTAEAMRLPLTATRLEHMGTVTPDVEASARFHSALFNPALHTEEQPVPLRLYVDLNGGYLAFGSRAGVETAFYDHFAALIADYSARGMKAAMRGVGEEPAANFDTFGLMQDPDGIGVQLVADPGGWFPTVIEAPALVEGPPLVTPSGLTHVLLQVGDLEASEAYYRTYFAGVRPRDDLGRVVVEMGPTELVMTEGGEPGILRIGVATAPFDMDQVGQAVEAMGGAAEMLDTMRGGILRVTDPFGLSIDLVPGAA